VNLKKLSVLAFAAKASAEAKIREIDAAHGYPRTEVGTRIGGGRHVDFVTTTTDDEPVQLADGTWGVAAERVVLAGLDARDAVEKDVPTTAEPVIADPGKG
jgi:hypothetical protein